MSYVQRDANGNINGVFANPQPGFATEFLADSDPAVVAFLNPPKPQTVLPQDLMAQFTPADIGSIQAAIAANTTQAALWYAMLAQRDPMMVTNARFQAGWSALVTILTQARMSAIATALGVTSLVV